MTLMTQIETVRKDLSLLKQDLQNFRERTSESERTISFVENTVSPFPLATDTRALQTAF